MIRIFFLFFLLSIVSVLSAQNKPIVKDTIIKYTTVVKVVEEEVLIGYDIGFKVNPLNLYLLSLNKSNTTLSSYSTQIYGGILINNISINSGLKFFTLLNTTFFSDSLELITLNTYKIKDTIDSYFVNVNGEIDERFVILDKNITEIDSSWDDISYTTTEKLNCFQIPLQVYYYYKLSKIDILISLGTIYNLPLNRKLEVSPFFTFISELGLRYYITNSFGCELLVNFQKGKIKSNVNSHWNNLHIVSAGLSLSCSFYL